MVITIPVSIWLTSHSMGNAPESSAVLKKIGAIALPKIYPPDRLFGTKGISLPMCHSTELIADLREEPVPTTSPTYATGCPFSLSWAIVSMPPGILDSNIAKACKGISGRVVAWGAGDKSSVLVSPGTLNTVTVIASASLGWVINHSAFAQESITCLAEGLTSDRARTSLEAS